LLGHDPGWEHEGKTEEQNYHPNVTSHHDCLLSAHQPAHPFEKFMEITTLSQAYYSQMNWECQTDVWTFGLQKFEEMA